MEFHKLYTDPRFIMTCGESCVSGTIYEDASTVVFENGYFKYLTRKEAAIREIKLQPFF